MNQNGYCYNSANMERSKARILLCDPNTESCREVLSLLCQLSYQVVAVCSDRQIFDALNYYGPDMDIILAPVDLLMFNGQEIFKYIMHQKVLQQIPLIMLSTKDQLSFIMNGMRLGAADYIVKPLKAEKFADLWMHINRRQNEAIEDCCSGLELINVNEDD